ncbi:hypothetical protein SAMN05444392_11081 [Seinonella peptonophila]|uniref:Uncharacterized protein n=1 Tax=Seinonella peptonophila TaxID=112248 RepID=A0A1M4ZRY1_9BACL|nr:hypothetical protein [Seinonella peptonophila]SHF20768.1 hypothetical protein SAMN05444392_11081 [Seinonella peptonophila]
MMSNKEISKGDMSAVILGLRDTGLKRNDIIEILEHVISYRYWKNDEELVDEAERFFGDLYKIAKDNYENDVYEGDKLEPLTEEPSIDLDNGGIKTIKDSVCQDCGDQFDQGIEFKYKRVLPGLCFGR